MQTRQRNRVGRRAVLASMAAAFAAGCAERDLFGDAEKPRPKGGIGGTGIVGTLAGFGSLIVNGLRVELDPAAEATSALGALPAADLAVGDSLTIEAAAGPAGLVARRVRLTHPVVGRIDARAPAERRLTVAGVPVRLAPGLSAGDFDVGARIAVSGLWDGDVVVASRIVAAPKGPAVLAGAVKRVSDGQALAIGGQRIAFAGGETPPVGAFVTAFGGPGAGFFVARRFEVGRFTGAAGPLERLAIEGYLEPLDRAPFHEVSGLGHSFDAAAVLEPFLGKRTLFVGVYEDVFKVGYGVDLPEALEARRALIARIAEEGSSGLRTPAR